MTPEQKKLLRIYIKEKRAKGESLTTEELDSADNNDFSFLDKAYGKENIGDNVSLLWNGLFAREAKNLAKETGKGMLNALNSPLVQSAFKTLNYGLDTGEQALRAGVKEKIFPTGVSKLIESYTNFNPGEAVYKEGDLGKAIDPNRLISSAPSDQISTQTDRLVDAGINPKVAMYMGLPSDIINGLVLGSVSNAAIPKLLSKSNLSKLANKTKSAGKKIGNYLFDKSYSELDDTFRRAYRGSATSKRLEEYPSLVEYLKKEKIVDPAKQLDRPDLSLLEKNAYKEAEGILNKKPRDIEFTVIKPKKTEGVDASKVGDPLSSNKSIMENIKLNTSEIEDPIYKSFPDDVLGKKVGKESDIYETYLKDVDKKRVSYSENMDNKIFADKLKNYKKDPTVTLEKELRKVDYKPIDSSKVIDDAAEKTIKSIAKDIENRYTDPYVLDEFLGKLEALKTRGKIHPADALVEKKWYNGKVGEIYEKRGLSEKTDTYMKQFYASTAKGYDKAIKETLSPSDLAKFNKANEDYKFFKTIDDLEKAAVKASKSSSMTPYDQALIASGSKLGVLRGGAKFIEAPVKMRKMGLGLMDDKIYDNFFNKLNPVLNKLDVLDNYNIIMNRTNPYIQQGK